MQHFLQKKCSYIFRQKKNIIFFGKKSIIFCKKKHIKYFAKKKLFQTEKLSFPKKKKKLLLRLGRGVGLEFLELRELLPRRGEIELAELLVQFHGFHHHHVLLVVVANLGYYKDVNIRFVSE